MGYLAFAENLGYSFAWAPDSQLLMSNPFALLALAAQQTRRIRLGTGLAVAGLRQAPVLANSIATINRLAPGRTFLGIGAGNTAVRTLGQRPMPVARMADYVRVVKGLLAGEEVAYTADGVTQLVRFQNSQLGHNDSPIPIHIGGLGPRAQALAGELGDGLVTSRPRGGTPDQIRTNVERGAAKTGRDLAGFELVALLNLVLLEPGESLASERVVADCGSAIMANVHYLVDLHRDTGAEPPDYIAPIWEEYLAFHATRDAERAHQQAPPEPLRLPRPGRGPLHHPRDHPQLLPGRHPRRDHRRATGPGGKRASPGSTSSIPNKARYRLTEEFARHVIARY